MDISKIKNLKINLLNYVSPEKDNGEHTGKSIFDKVHSININIGRLFKTIKELYSISDDIECSEDNVNEQCLEIISEICESEIKVFLKNNNFTHLGVSYDLDDNNVSNAIDYKTIKVINKSNHNGIVEFLKMS